MRPLRFAVLPLTVLVLASCYSRVGAAADPWVVYPGGNGPGAGRRIVLISGDEEYRSEECLPQLGKILSVRHGFSCTVLFAIDPATGEIKPDVLNNIPGLEALDSADLMIIATRFRDLPDEQMQHVADYLASGKPVLGMRTATHAFAPSEGSAFAHYHAVKSTTWQGGFGRQVLGETWVNHHGRHKHESTRGLIAPGQESHPIVRGCDDIWGPSDVYSVRLPLPWDSQPLVLGQVLTGMQPSDPPLPGPKNDPMMPIAWIKTYDAQGGTTARVFTTTMGAATDLESAGLRRLVVNAAYWCLGMEDRIPECANVDLVGEYRPSAYGFDGYKPGVSPAAYALP